MGGLSWVELGWVGLGGVVGWVGWWVSGWVVTMQPPTGSGCVCVGGWVCVCGWVELGWAASGLVGSLFFSARPHAFFLGADCGPTWRRAFFLGASCGR